jgi:hypothetical protein
MKSLQTEPFFAESRSSLCPFHDGAPTLDLLLAELDPAERELFDAVLDLRSLFIGGGDAHECVNQLFHVRYLLGGRHYLAFYRVRCLAARTFRVQVRADRGSPWIERAFPVDGARIDEVLNDAVASLASEAQLPEFAQARIVFSDLVAVG